MLFIAKNDVNDVSKLSSCRIMAKTVNFQIFDLESKCHGHQLKDLVKISQPYASCRHAKIC